MGQRLSVRLEDELVDALDEFSKQATQTDDNGEKTEGVSRSLVVRHVLREYLLRKGYLR